MSKEQSAKETANRTSAFGSRGSRARDLQGCVPATRSGPEIHGENKHGTHRFVQMCFCVLDGACWVSTCSVLEVCTSGSSKPSVVPCCAGSSGNKWILDDEILNILSSTIPQLIINQRSFLNSIRQYGLIFMD